MTIWMCEHCSCCPLWQRVLARVFTADEVAAVLHLFRLCPCVRCVVCLMHLEHGAVDCPGGKRQGRRLVVVCMLVRGSAGMALDQVCHTVCAICAVDVVLWL
jgi:hypothetical protein